MPEEEEDQLAGMDAEGLRRVLGELLSSNRETQANLDAIRQQFPIQPDNVANEIPTWSELEEGGLEPPEPEEGEGESFAEQLLPELEELLEIPSAVLSAVVSSAGKLNRGKGASKVVKTATGTYEVFFEKDVTDGTYTATIGKPGHEGTEDPGFVTVVRLAEDPTVILVQTYDDSGLAADKGFHLMVAF